MTTQTKGWQNILGLPKQYQPIDGNGLPFDGYGFVKEGKAQRFPNISWEGPGLWCFVDSKGKYLNAVLSHWMHIPPAPVDLEGER